MLNDCESYCIIRELKDILPTDIVQSIVIPYLKTDNIQETVLYGHDSYVLSVCATSDGKIISGSYDNTVRIWDIDSGKLLRTLRGHTGSVYSVYVNNGNIISLSRDKTARVWNTNGQLIKCLQMYDYTRCNTIFVPDKILKGHEDYVYSVCMTSSGKIVSGSADKTVRVWDMNTGDIIHKLRHDDSVYSVCTTNDGKIVSGSRDNTVRVWDMTTGDLLHTFRHNNWVSSVCATADNIIISGSWDNTIRIWRKRTFDIKFSKPHVQPSYECSLM